ncbi:MAG: hypothetical protein KDA24_25990 [Deltaproteobacteria bacterium]|nr:hypothetical protein [Deltaproteobacteria bacterium]
MEEVLIPLVFFGTPVVMLCVVCGSLLLRGYTARYFALKHKELELKQWEAEQRVQHLSELNELPPWLDATSAADVAAWQRALVETYRGSAIRRVNQLN